MTSSPAPKLSFVIAGSKDSEEDALKSYKDILANHSEMLEDKKMYYTQLLERGRINIPDKKLQEVYNWCKINTEWLAADMESAYPNADASPIDLTPFTACEAVLDIIYNPKETRLTAQAKTRGMKGVTGLCMLTAQAKYACEYFLDRRMDDSVIEKVTCLIEDTL